MEVVSKEENSTLPSPFKKITLELSGEEYVLLFTVLGYTTCGSRDRIYEGWGSLGSNLFLSMYDHCPCLFDLLGAKRG